MEWRHLTETLIRYGDMLVNTYRNKLSTEGINASGKLSNSVKFELKLGDTTLEVGLWLEDYYKWIEQGRPRTTHSGNGELRRAILNWIKVKPVVPRPYNGKLPAEEQLAYLISRKIHREGYRGRNVLHKSVEEVNNAMLLDIKYAIVEDLREDMNEVLVMLQNMKG